jgi:hypothetical protein
VPSSLLNIETSPEAGYRGPYMPADSRLCAAWLNRAQMCLKGLDFSAFLQERPVVFPG